ncbi:helix-turn-helix transcriptional regulator [Leptospira santarosai]|uniref:DNA-binding helix-turn-helix protein n=1 Tax=Leptospira santarosai TaxID=28183 RepID=A0A0M2WZB9_9LEPT|nr:helix-turn-helix domain-containing protein [Leptospira santarosai]AVQ11251.1 DNA-binding helix-turn-helix protein [Leptospira santarosai]AVV51433.1 DNA-binding helix-turn-helix protein [Leptospira santarosai]AVV79197.1 DNA-binding helix-turn-helix protein [Leptospira santarosai]MDI7174829.1 helix-turn-helix domain-containing protein [Leptospira santarosai]MDI7193812.1 helix-turn-helix domain-containing protein [Leptospira santarosai]
MKANDSTPGRRLSETISVLGINQTEFADSIGSSQQTISRWISGKLTITRIDALAVEAVHKISHQWLLNGKGQMFDLPESQKTDITSLSKMTEFIRKINQAKGLKPLIDDFILLPESDQDMIRNLVKHFKNKL